MKESKLQPLSEIEKKSAEENHNIIYAFLKRYGYSVESYYNVAVFGYLKGIQAYYRNESLRKKYDLFFICWQHMRVEMSNYFRLQNVQKRKPVEKDLSLDADFFEYGSFHDCIGGKSIEMEVLEAESFNELLEKLSEIQRGIVKMKMDGYKNFEIFPVLNIKPATFYREMQRIKAILENI